MCIDKYKILVVSNAHYFLSVFKRVIALDRCQNFVYAQYLGIDLWISNKFCICIDIDKM